jgi:Na+-transporting NADH:ubiquinone oxidoreductase subunit NqrB
MPQALYRELKTTVPPFSDPRWRQMGLHAVFLAYALTTPLFRRTPAQYAAGLTATVAVEWAFQYARSRRVFFPLSALITSMGLQLLCTASSPWVYAALGAAAMAGKTLLRVRGRHLFNPSNAVLVASLLLLPAGAVAVPLGWGGGAAGLIAAGAAGLAAMALAGRLAIVGAYAVSFLAGAWLLHAAAGMPFSAAAAPMAGPLFPIFAFFMVPDPQTTPRAPRQAAAFGLALGAAETVLRAGGAVYAPFYALFLLTPLNAALAPDPAAGASPRAG